MAGRDPSLALWAVNQGAGWPGEDAFLADADAQIARAAAAGADLLILPEHVAEGWLAWAPPDLPETGEIAWMAEAAQRLVPALARRAHAAGIDLLAGTAPAAHAGHFRNRAALHLRDGRTVVQDKLVLTPDERDPQAWQLVPGDRLTVARWQGWRVAIAVCLDVEQPSLAARLQPLDLDLLLVPSDTAALSGHHRVFACARARAVELACAVAVVGGIGTIPRPPDRPNVSGAAVYLPCEMVLGGTGVHAELGPLAAADGPGPLLIARDLPLTRLRALRRRGAEVWPGPWPAEHVAFVEPDG